MARYQRGSKGEEVSRIQARRKELGSYLDPIDANFGGGTEAAVEAFQRDTHLEAGGVVSPNTWAALFDGANREVPPPGERSTLPERAAEIG